MISTNIKTDVKQEIKELVAGSCNFPQKYLLKIEIQYKAGLYFSFNLGWHCIQFDSLSVTHPLDTGRKLNVHKSFRRRPGRIQLLRLYASTY